MDPDQYLVLMDPDADPGGQKHTDPDPQHWPQLLQFTCVLVTEHHTKEAIVF
jgi:hypothetical protein